MDESTIVDLYWECQIWANMDVVPLNQLVWKLGTPLLVLGLSLIMFKFMERMNEARPTKLFMCYWEKALKLEYLYDYVCS